MFELSKTAADVLEQLSTDFLDFGKTPHQEKQGEASIVRRIMQMTSGDALRLSAFLSYKHARNQHTLLENCALQTSLTGLADTSPETKKYAIMTLNHLFMGVLRDQCIFESTLQPAAFGVPSWTRTLGLLSEVLMNGLPCDGIDPIFTVVLILSELARLGLKSRELILQCPAAHNELKRMFRDDSLPAHYKHVVFEVLFRVALGSNPASQNWQQVRISASWDPSAQFHLLKRTLDDAVAVVTAAAKDSGWDGIRDHIQDRHISDITHALLQMFYFKSTCWAIYTGEKDVSRLMLGQRGRYIGALKASIENFQISLGIKRSKSGLLDNMGSYRLQAPPRKACQKLSDKINVFLRAEFMDLDAMDQIEALLRVAMVELAVFSACAGIFWSNYHIHLKYRHEHMLDEDPGGHTRLHGACYGPNIAEAKRLLAAHKSLALRTTYGQGHSPAHYCTFFQLKGQISERFQLLYLLHDANPDCIFVRCKDGVTPQERAGANHGLYRAAGREMAEWLEKRMVARGWARLGRYGWFPPVSPEGSAPLVTEEISSTARDLVAAASTAFGTGGSVPSFASVAAAAPAATASVVGKEIWSGQVIGDAAQASQQNWEHRMPNSAHLQAATEAGDDSSRNSQVIE